ncbi:MAG: sulfur oxidation c-type cytochrome SoxX [Gammaproteobacteria bacterium]|nr:sulfur oxidation c-type cytochrome SoxX [Gammaproteobacteria bacterium]MBT4494916.1 sulfur oxidation c-type cytochrome SoxX [Gammaproteobacteria bacterium]MBT7369998.1 sulfur oxidation c-type cytochrome SoxX [Gammaproteobacteria bacterium]
MADDINKGRELAFDRSRGNCLACHMMEGGEMPGNVAPPLIAMKTRFPERSVLREQVWDATIRNPESVMPPYGRHGVLTEEEIDQVVDFVHSL